MIVDGGKLHGLFATQGGVILSSPGSAIQKTMQRGSGSTRKLEREQTDAGKRRRGKKPGEIVHMFFPACLALGPSDRRTTYLKDYFQVDQNVCDWNEGPRL